MAHKERASSKETAKKVKDLLDSEGIKSSEDFLEELIKSSEKYNLGILPEIEAFKNVLKCCQYWKEYCRNEEEYSKLVCSGCISMARIRASVISTISENKSFIGKACVLSSKQLPECVTTVAGVRKAIIYDGLSTLERPI